jgi:cell wall-associated NlpC family hydrolase
LKFYGCDCVGLIRGVAQNVGIAYDRALWKRFANYSRQPSPARMAEGLALFMVAIDDSDLMPGDVLFIEWRENLPMHLAIYANDGGRATVIHALADVGKVCEHGFTAPWPDRVVSCWRFPQGVV